MFVLYLIKLIDMALSADGKFLITLSKDSTFVFQWSLNPRYEKKYYFDGRNFIPIESWRARKIIKS